MLEVNSYFISAYGYEDKEGKLLLKLWKYSNDTGLISKVTYAEYRNSFLITDVISLTKGYCIDISDIGNIEECVRLLVGADKRRNRVV